VEPTATVALEPVSLVPLQTIAAMLTVLRTAQQKVIILIQTVHRYRQRVLRAVFQQSLH
jgi:hypothetical protein